MFFEIVRRVFIAHIVLCHNMSGALCLASNTQIYILMNALPCTRLNSVDKNKLIICDTVSPLDVVFFLLVSTTCRFLFFNSKFRLSTSALR